MVFGSMRRGAAGGSTSSGFLKDIEDVSLDTNLFCCLDAGNIDSYDGSGQTWADQTSNGTDFWLGADGGSSTDDPSFQGVAGAESNAEYFLLDGGDFFTVKVMSTNIQNLHKDSADWTIVAWVFIPTGGWSLNDGWFGDADATASTVGVYTPTAASTAARLEVNKGSAGAAMSETTAVGIGTANAWNLIGISLDEAAGGSASFFYKRSGGSSTATTFDATYTSPSAASATYDFAIGQKGSGSGILDNLTRFAGFFMFNASLTQANLDSIYTQTNGSRSFV
tara:strand:+ start:5265 stop:6104 length:840 start_codon:yes stop_codon:yes gene_type:complete